MDLGNGPTQRARPTGALRVVAVLLWTGLLAAFWLSARGVAGGPVQYLMTTVDGLSAWRWAAAGLVGLYLLRPLLLVPITVLNLASGLLLGPALGIGVALLGTLISASAGYCLGYYFGTTEMVGALESRWPLIRMLRSRGFEAVVAGGLMYLHADLVNMPAGLLRVPFATFLAAIPLGNALTMTTAVLTGASVEGSITNATVGFRLEYLAIALTLFLLSLGLAYALRKRMRRENTV